MSGVATEDHRPGWAWRWIFRPLLGLTFFAFVSVALGLLLQHGVPATAFPTPLTDILGMLAAGVDQDEILRDYPYLEREDIQAALEYAAAQADHLVIKSA